MSEMKWYVIRTNSGWEKKVKKYFESEIEKFDLKNRVSQIVIPTHKEFYVRNGKKVTREVNYFPGYVLLEADMCGEFTGIVKNITGAINFLGPKNGLPEPLKQTEVEKILGKIDEMKEGRMRDTIDLVKALADETRLRALCALRGGELCVCQITESFGMAPSTVSKHLSILYQAGLVESRKTDRWVYYRLPDKKDSATVRAALAWVIKANENEPQISDDTKQIKQILKTDLAEI